MLRQRRPAASLLEPLLGGGDEGAPPEPAGAAVGTAYPRLWSVLAPLCTFVGAQRNATHPCARPPRARS